MSDKPKNNAKRRDLLKLAGLVPVAAAAALTGAAPANAEAVAAVEPDGYRESEHIRKYYASARS